MEEGEFELGGRKIPAQRKPYSTLETNYLIRQLKKQAERDDLIPEENKIKNIVKEFADYKNNEELNQYIDTLDQSIADATKVFFFCFCFVFIVGGVLLLERAKKGGKRKLILFAEIRRRELLEIKKTLPQKLSLIPPLPFPLLCPPPPPTENCSRPNQRIRTT